MFTKPLTRPSITALDVSTDKDTINRLLVAAAVKPKFGARLLADPQQALRAGFGGEGFPLSRHTHEALTAIRASSLPELASKLNEILSSQPRAS